MISASHNAFADNGIPFFAAGGRKLPDDVEGRLEAELGRPVTRVPTGADVGRVSFAGDAVARYCDALVGSLEGRRLDGLHVVVDCAHGAASDVAPAVLRRLGAEVEVIHAQPDGTNINAGCGSTHPESLQRSVVALGADAGLAFDGDADRVLAVDASGVLVDGDQLIAICALDLRSRGRLKDDTVVVTVMTNLGFHLAMADHGVRVEQTAVGDRYVLEALGRGGWSLGGEQSGHVIFSELATTGDGVLTGLQVLDVMRRSGRPLSDLASVMTRLPQVLENVRVRDRDALDHAGALDAEVAAVEAELGDHGRVLIRPSGTEPLVRVMVEAPTADQAQAAADRLAAAVTAACGTETNRG
jgi:phosphoglucosamine mutase